MGCSKSMINSSYQSILEQKTTQQKKQKLYSQLKKGGQRNTPKNWTPTQGPLILLLKILNIQSITKEENEIHDNSILHINLFPLLFHSVKIIKAIMADSLIQKIFWQKFPNQSSKSSQNRNRPQCHVCGKPGHIALHCWHRFNQDFKPSSSSFNNTGQGSMPPMLTTPCTAFDSNWYPDSGATNHVTSDPANLVHKTTYTGPDQIHIRDGAGPQIRHIGSSSFTSQFDSKILTLNHLLHVSSITKNLLSVSKFASENSVFFEFFPNKCYVKDQATHNILMEGKLKQGLYVFDPPKFLSTSASKVLPNINTKCQSPLILSECFCFQFNL